MKIKLLGYIVSAFALTTLLASCSSSSQMASSFGSRKYIKGYFFNSPGSGNTTATTAKTSVAPTITTQTNATLATNIAPVTANSAAGTAALKEQNKQVMPVQTGNKKITFKEAIALAKQKATIASSAAQPITAIASTEGTNKVETTASTQWHHEGEGGGHLVFSIVILLLMILLIVLVVSLAEQS